MKITHFPVIHCRKGSIGYKLEWKGLSHDLHERHQAGELGVKQANGGKAIDVFIHEMIVPPEIWAMQAAHMPAPDYPNPTNVATVKRMTNVQASSHTPQGAYGFLLSQIDPKPRLAVATHFPVADDTVHCAMNSVAQYVPDIGGLGEKLTFSFDRMPISVNHRTGAIVNARLRRSTSVDATRVDRSMKDVEPPKYADPYMSGTARRSKPSDGYRETGY